jgi:hypothetical protein
VHETVESKSGSVNDDFIYDSEYIFIQFCMDI